jgi:hypothetical protein
VGAGVIGAGVRTWGRVDELIGRLISKRNPNNDSELLGTVIRRDDSNGLIVRWANGDIDNLEEADIRSSLVSSRTESGSRHKEDHSSDVDDQALNDSLQSDGTRPQTQIVGNFQGSARDSEALQNIAAEMLVFEVFFIFISLIVTSLPPICFLD